MKKTPANIVTNFTMNFKTLIGLAKRIKEITALHKMFGGVAEKLVKMLKGAN